MHVSPDLNTKKEDSDKIIGEEITTTVPSSIPSSYPRRSGYKGVYWASSRNSSWVAQWSVNGKQCKKYFSSAQHGDEQALRLAIQWRKANEVNPQPTRAMVNVCKEAGARKHAYQADRAAVHLPMDLDVSKLSDADLSPLFFVWRASLCYITPQTPSSYGAWATTWHDGSNLHTFLLECKKSHKKTIPPRCLYGR
eukprot:GHVR01071003.1.p1 GENE.GHVR01071003.1~~GHVR01071003.1.p1  ORF type:complete len:195 (+),score=32.67 GHVR01071003.1:55-639(+)